MHGQPSPTASLRTMQVALLLYTARRANPPQRLAIHLRFLRLLKVEDPTQYETLWNYDNYVYKNMITYAYYCKHICWAEHRANALCPPNIAKSCTQWESSRQSALLHPLTNVCRISVNRGLSLVVHTTPEIAQWHESTFQIWMSENGATTLNKS